MTTAAHDCSQQDKTRDIAASQPFVLGLGALIATVSVWVWANVCAKYAIPHRMIIFKQQKNKREIKETRDGAVALARYPGGHMYIIFFSSTRTNII